MLSQESCSLSHVQAVAHLLPSQRNATVDSLEDVHASLVGGLCVNDIEREIEVSETILKLGVQVFKSFAVQITTVGQIESKFIFRKPPECGQALQTVYYDAPSLVVFSEIEDRERNPHQDGLDQLTLFGIVPDEVALEVGVHNISTILYPA